MDARELAVRLTATTTQPRRPIVTSTAIRMPVRENKSALDVFRHPFPDAA